MFLLIRAAGTLWATVSGIALSLDQASTDLTASSAAKAGTAAKRALSAAYVFGI